MVAIYFDKVLSERWEILRKDGGFTNNSVFVIHLMDLETERQNNIRLQSQESREDDSSIEVIDLEMEADDVYEEKVIALPPDTLRFDIGQRLNRLAHRTQGAAIDHDVMRIAEGAEDIKLDLVDDDGTELESTPEEDVRNPPVPIALPVVTKNHKLAAKYGPNRFEPEIDENEAIVELPATEGLTIVTKCLQLAAKYKLDCTQLQNGEVLEMYNLLSFCRPFPKSFFSMCPIKCIVSGDEARLFFFGKHVGEAATTAEDVTHMISQLSTYSAYVFCPGLGLGTSKDSEKETRSLNCMYWFRTSKTRYLLKSKLNGEWKTRCRFCKYLRFRRMNPKSLSANNGPTSKANLAFLGFLTRAQLEQRYRVLRLVFERTKKNILRLESKSRRTPLVDIKVTKFVLEPEEDWSKYSAKTVPDAGDLLGRDSHNSSGSETDSQGSVLESGIQIVEDCIPDNYSFLKKARLLARNYKLNCSQLLEGEVLEIYNRRSYCRPFPGSDFSLCPIKCIVSYGEARLFLFELEVGKVVRMSNDLDALIGQLATDSPYVYCPGFEPEPFADHNPEDRSPKCSYWFKSMQDKLLERKQRNDWKMLCRFCKALEVVRWQRKKSTDPRKTEFISEVHLTAMTRAELEARYKRLRGVHNVARRNFKRMMLRKNLDDIHLEDDVPGLDIDDLMGTVPENDEVGCGIDGELEVHAFQKLLKTEFFELTKTGAETAAGLCDNEMDPEDDLTSDSVDQSDTAKAGAHTHSVEIENITDCVGDKVESMDNFSSVDESLTAQVVNCSSAVEDAKADQAVDTDPYEPLSDDDVTESGESAIKCANCDKYFKSLVALAVHSKCTHRCTDHVCALCSQWFISREALDYHTASEKQHKEHVAKTLLCNCCGWRFTNQRKCQEHKRNAHSLFECPWCGFVTMKFAKLQKHITRCDEKTDDPYRCSACFYGFTSDNNLVSHRFLVHQLATCFRCKADFKTKAELTTHKMKCIPRTRPPIVHDLKCHECNITYCSFASINRHKVDMHEEVFCPKCRYAIPKGKMATHYDVCIAKNRCVDCRKTRCECKEGFYKFPRNEYKCTHCPSVFQGYMRFRRHMKDTHKESISSQQPKICPICAKEVISIKTHMSIHDQTKTENCRFCPQLFKTKQSVRVHEASVHMKEASLSGSIITATVKKRKAGGYNYKTLTDCFACFDCDFTHADFTEVEKHLTSHFKESRKCQFCGDRLDETTFQGHMKGHVPTVAKCERCGFVIFGSMLKRHTACSSEVRPAYGSVYLGFKLNENLVFRCKHCDFTSESYRNNLGSMSLSLTSHLRGQHNINISEMPKKDSKSPYATEVRRFKCGQCEFAGKTARCLQQHVQIKHSGKVKCDVCPAILGSVPALKQHMKGMHNNLVESGESVAKKCPKCGKMVKALFSHLKIHEKHRHRCPVCAKGFHSGSGLREHATVHTGEKRHKCKTCGKCFARLPNFGVHLRTHLAVRPFLCDICSKGFNEKRNLQRHLKLTHAVDY